MICFPAPQHNITPSGSRSGSRQMQGRRYLLAPASQQRGWGSARCMLVISGGGKAHQDNRGCQMMSGLGSSQTSSDLQRSAILRLQPGLHVLTAAAAQGCHFRRLTYLLYDLPPSNIPGACRQCRYVQILSIEACLHSAQIV